MSLLLALTACGQKAEATPTLAAAVPYQTTAPTQTPSRIPGMTRIIQPTPTVFTYTVVQGDTLSSIAQRHGISLEALLAANPGISATTLSIGTKLVIPAGGQATSEPTVTPAPLPVQQARCWPEATGGSWCLALLKNDYAETLENISAQFILIDSSGKELATQVAYGLLDILPPGSAMPLAAHFAGPVEADVSLQVQVLTAIRLLPGDTRYLPVRLENTLVSVDASGRTAEVSGRVLLASPGTANTLWVLASAYDGSGNVVGIRRWESETALKADATISFNFSVSSVGPAIDRVEFLAEARP
jgi:phage tail protein X